MKARTLVTIALLCVGLSSCGASAITATDPSRTVRQSGQKSTKSDRQILPEDSADNRPIKRAPARVEKGLPFKAAVRAAAPRRPPRLAPAKMPRLRSDHAS